MTMWMGIAGLPMVDALGWTLLHFCWQGAAVAVGLWCALGLMPARMSRARYGAACVALGLMVALPVATFARLAAEEMAAGQAVAMPIAMEVSVYAGGAGATQEPWRERVREALDAAAPWVPAVWLVGVICFLGRLSVGLMVARRMRWVGTTAAPDALRESLERLRGRLGVARAVGLMHSAMVEAPTVIGWLRPVVLVPAGCFMGLSEMQVEALLAHELAHVRRHDYLVSVVQSVVETLLFYHPAVWWVSRQVRRERECCCDELAVEVAGDRLVYARALSWLEEHRAAMPEIVLGANGGVLTMRIRRLLGLRERSAGSQAAAAVLLAGFVVSAGVLLGSAARAQRGAETSAAGSSPVVAQSLAEGLTASSNEVAVPDPLGRKLAQSERAAGKPSQPEGRGSYATWLNQDVVWIITPEERAGFLRLRTDEERDQFIEQFWARRNPTPGAPENSFKNEHYGRIAYANQHFGRGTEVPGWKTDRGHIYIAYGKPDEIDSHPSGGGKESDPFEVWSYRHINGIGDNVDVEFVDTCRCGEYHYTIDRTERDLLKGGPGAAGVQTPQMDRLALAAKVLSAPREVSYRAQGGAGQASAGAVQGSGAISGVVMDKTGAVVARAKLTAVNTDTGKQTTEITDNSGKYSFAGLAAGNYNVEVEAPGFSRLVQENVRVDGRQMAGFNLRLSVGAVKETLNVTAAPLAVPVAVAPPPPPPPPSADAKRPVGPVRVSSGTIAGNLITKVDPVYPDEARAKRVQGAVVLKATISKEGTVENVQVESGPVELVVSAVDAVRQWTYKPYLLNGEPTEVNTTITVNYALAGEAGAQGRASAVQTAALRAEAVRLQMQAESGGDVGVAPKRIGGGVSAPVLIHQVDPEFSEEARKAHVSGIVIVALVVDEQGNPTHVKVLRGVGVGPDGKIDPKFGKADTDGLNEKAVEAVRQYKFTPAMEDGKPVTVALNVEVNFQIF